MLAALVLSCGGRIADPNVDAGSKDAAPTKDGGADATVDANLVFDPLCGVTTTPSKGACAEGLFGCNPVTNGGCDGASGEACDVGASGDFQCYPAPPPNTADLCAECDDSNVACKPTSTCLPLNGLTTTSSCAKFCCADADCAGGHCDKTWLSTTVVGVCVK